MKTNKRAVVTGGTRGIGLAIATKLKQDGHEVLITGTSENHSLNKEFIYKAANFSSLENIKEFAIFLHDFSPDILINNAGINKISKFNDVIPEDFLQIHQVNTTAPFYFCQAVLSNMKKNNWGRIINITSIWSKISKLGRAAYSVSKFGLDGMTAALAAEVAEHGILVNCVAPGFIETDLTKETLGENGMCEIAKQIPIKRLGKPEEIAAFVAWLVSEENSYISGQNLVIDGGFTRV
ncbi:MAG: Dehydrogenases with different specificities (short-chain alcohol dehydrogenases) [uncultured bacterium]|nr:MAG: Dehydrogenases with different specificities (short-chain alcohol dehydrogenases) [uncultured bacterium]